MVIQIVDYLLWSQPDILLMLQALRLMTPDAWGEPTVVVPFEFIRWQSLMQHDQWRRVGRRVRQVGRRT
jgi:hypothetical protein